MLRSAREKSPVREINAHQLIDLIALSAWKSAEPGLIFFDQINKYMSLQKQEVTTSCNNQGEIAVSIRVM